MKTRVSYLVTFTVTFILKIAIFSSPEPKAHVSYCDHMSVVNFWHFRLLLRNRWTDFDETSQEASPQRPLPSCVFRADPSSKMAALASDWLKHFYDWRIHFLLLLCNRWTDSDETLQEASTQCPLPSLCFSCRSVTQDGSVAQDGRPGLWLAETFSTSSLKPLNGFWWNFTGSKYSTSSTKFVFFVPICHPRWTALASDWLRHFRLLGNHWMDFDKISQEASPQRLLPRLWFSGPSIIQDGRPRLWFVETFSTSPPQPLNGFWGNLTGSKTSTSSTKFVFFMPNRHPRWLPWPLIGWNIFMPPDRLIGDILYLSCVFVCLSVVNFNLRHNFWTMRDRYFIFGTHTQLIEPFQMTPRLMNLWPWLWHWG